MWRWIKKRRRRTAQKRGSGAHYRAHKEAARALVHARLLVLNTTYQHSWGRVAIKDQKSRWGSCSMKGNLNFNYRLLFLPSHLVDYVIAHELAHLKEFNHGPQFWELVGRTVPEYKAHRAELRKTKVVRGKAIQFP